LKNLHHSQLANLLLRLFLYYLFFVLYSFPLIIIILFIITYQNLHNQMDRAYLFAGLRIGSNFLSFIEKNNLNTLWFLKVFSKNVFFVQTLVTFLSFCSHNRFMICILILLQVHHSVLVL